MSQHILFLLLGLGNGAVFAALAVCAGRHLPQLGRRQLRDRQRSRCTSRTPTRSCARASCCIPIPGLPATIDLGGPLSFSARVRSSRSSSPRCSACCSTSSCSGRCASAPPVAKAVASIGVTVVMPGCARAAGRYRCRWSWTRSCRRTLDDLGSSDVQVDRLWLAAAVVGVTHRAGRVPVHALRTGTRAAAETEKGALVTGLSPDRIAMANWAVGAVVAGISRDPDLADRASSADLVHPVHRPRPRGRAGRPASSISDRSRSTASLIGMLQSELVFLHGTAHVAAREGLAELVPLVLDPRGTCVRARPAVAVARRADPADPRPRARPRGDPRRPPSSESRSAWSALLVVHGSCRPRSSPRLIFGVISLSLVVVTGYAGQVSLAQLTLAGVGGFMLSRLTTRLGCPVPHRPAARRARRHDRRRRGRSARAADTGPERRAS